MNVEFVDIVETPELTSMIANATSGESHLSTSEAIIDTDSPRMVIPSSANVRVINDEAPTRTEKRRRLVPTTGTLKTLVIRLGDSNKVWNTLSVAQMKDDIFEDESSLATQTDACSYGKLKIEPFSGKTPSGRNINGGVVNVKVKKPVSDSNFESEAINEAKKQLGDLNDSRFDLIMFCYPPGLDFTAYAYPNGKYSFYSNDWCGAVAGQMHEVGHNLGLAHSGETGQNEYGDHTGYMGSSPLTDDHYMCFNPQKSYQLGWYDDKVATINPLDGLGEREYTLNGVVDYERNNDALIVLRLEQTDRVQDYYIGFNKAEGMNKDSSEHRNLVTIVRKESGAPEKYGKSTKIAALAIGQSKIIPNFNGSGDVQVLFKGLKNGNAVIVVADHKGNLNEHNGSCERYTMEVMTDKYPGDNRWWIIDDSDGTGVAFSTTFDKANHKYRQELCIPQYKQKTTYRFTITDNYGDGLCCNQGQGYYKLLNKNNQVVFEGGQGFDEKQHTFQVARDPNPPAPTRPPTLPPTAAPTETPECKDYTIEVKTDRYPGDTSWKVIGWNNKNEEITFAESDSYNKQDTFYSDTVCLQEKRDFEFRFFDSFKDGLCCGYGEGYYRVLDSCGEVVVDSDKTDENFEQKVHSFKTSRKNANCAFNDNDESSDDAPAPTRAPTNPPTNKPTKKPTNKKCRNKVGKFQIKGNKGPNRNCKQHAKFGKCNNVMHNGQFVWERCKKSCGKC